MEFSKTFWKGFPKFNSELQARKSLLTSRFQKRLSSFCFEFSQKCYLTWDRLWCTQHNTYFQASETNPVHWHLALCLLTCFSQSFVTRVFTCCPGAVRILSWVLNTVTQLNHWIEAEHWTLYDRFSHLRLTNLFSVLILEQPRLPSAER